jgi:hypothetical protein
MESRENHSMAKSYDAEIAALTKQLRDLETQRENLEARLATLSQVLPSEAHLVPSRPSEGRSPQEKVDLFRKLFAGRPDVFALRWDNAQDGRSGYAPACSNEWAAGICGKPKIKCGVCPNQAFIPVSDGVVRSRLHKCPTSCFQRGSSVESISSRLEILRAHRRRPVWHGSKQR